MGHALFIILHIVAVLFGFVFLVITIPTHLIYAVLAGKSKAPEASTGAVGPSLRTHRQCPACKELILPEAEKCKHCGSAVVPDHDFKRRSMEYERAKAQEGTKNLLIGIGFIVLLILMASLISK